MRRDATEFRERFAKWKNGEKYWAIKGQPLPHYKEGKDYDQWIDNLSKKWNVSRKELEQDDYDYERFYNNNPIDAQAILNGNRNVHFPDTYKFPTHPTFSNESVYSGKNGNVVGGSWTYNPKNLQHWTYKLSPSQVKNNWDVIRTLKYAADAENDGFMITDNKGRLPIINNTVEGGVLPEVIIKPKRKSNRVTYEDYEILKQKLSERQDNTNVYKEPVITPIKRVYGSVVPESLVQKKLEEQPIIQQDDYTQKAIREAQNKRTWLSDAADFAHSVGEAAMLASNFVNPLGGRLINSFANVTKNNLNGVSNAITKYNTYRKINKLSKTIESEKSARLFDSYMKDWFNNETSFYLPYKMKVDNRELKVGDVIDYSFDGFGGQSNSLSNLTKDQRYDLAVLQTRSFNFPKQSKLIHMDASGVQPVNQKGFVPKDATNSKSQWNSALKGDPEIWWNKGTPYYNAYGYRSYLDIPRTIVSSVEDLSNAGIKLQGTNVIHGPGVVPFDAIHYGIEPSPYGWFERIKFK